MCNRPTDRELLIALLFETILETERSLHRTPTRAELLDYLFSPSRTDPEARELERKLAPLLTSALEDWARMDEERTAEEGA
jgi:hypothetical protein